MTYDFTRSLPPVPEGLGSALSDALRGVSALDLADVGRASSPQARQVDREAGAAWLARSFQTPIDSSRLTITNGAQSAVLILLQGLLAGGKRLVSECLTYGMLGPLARIAGIPVLGLPIDEEGLDAEAFDQACRGGNVGALYCNPTFHNPTAVVMGVERRRAVAEIARHHGIPIIEDDPIGLLYTDLPPPIASFAPELAWYVATMTKTIAQGMRVAYLLGPQDSGCEAVLAPFSRLSHWVGAPLMVAAATWLIEMGRAAELRNAIAAENVERVAEARRILPADSFFCAPGSPHLWIALEGSMLEEVTEGLAQADVLARREHLFAVDDDRSGPTGIRLSLSSPRDRAMVREGLTRTAHVLRQCAAPSREETSGTSLRP